MSMEDIEKAICEAIEADMARTALRLELPAEMLEKGYEITKGFNEYIEMAKNRVEMVGVDALVCTMIGMVIFPEEIYGYDKLLRIKTAWDTIKDWIREGERDVSEEHEGV